MGGAGGLGADPNANFLISNSKPEVKTKTKNLSIYKKTAKVAKNLKFQKILENSPRHCLNETAYQI